MSNIFGQKDYKSQLDGLCCVEITADFCGSCIHLRPVLQEVSAKFGFKFLEIKADVDTENIIKEWNIEKVPTILLMDNGKIFARCAGYQPEEILEIWMDSKIEDYMASKN